MKDMKRTHRYLMDNDTKTDLGFCLTGSSEDGNRGRAQKSCRFLRLKVDHNTSILSAEEGAQDVGAGDANSWHSTKL